MFGVTQDGGCGSATTTAHFYGILFPSLVLSSSFGNFFDRILWSEVTVLNGRLAVLVPRRWRLNRSTASMDFSYGPIWTSTRRQRDVVQSPGGLLWGVARQLGQAGTKRLPHGVSVLAYLTCGTSAYSVRSTNLFVIAPWTPQSVREL